MSIREMTDEERAEFWRIERRNEAMIREGRAAYRQRAIDFASDADGEWAEIDHLCGRYQPRNFVSPREEEWNDDDLWEEDRIVNGAVYGHDDRMEDTDYGRPIGDGSAMYLNDDRGVRRWARLTRNAFGCGSTICAPPLRGRVSANCAENTVTAA